MVIMALLAFSTKTTGAKYVLAAFCHTAGELVNYCNENYIVFDVNMAMSENS